jgi:hypothetical protein
MIHIGADRSFEHNTFMMIFKSYMFRSKMIVIWYSSTKSLKKIKIFQFEIPVKY